MKTTLLHRKNKLEEMLGQELADGQQIILKTLAYFDIFQYPLTKDELQQFAGGPLTDELFIECLDTLEQSHKIFVHREFYSLQNNPLLVHRRKQGNQRAVRLLKKANKIGRFLYQFPFVKAVGISGSLSKNFADEKADIDFFIITSANRLWLARTFMHFYKKLTFLTGRQHFYCMNYYVDEEALALDDKNIFTAIELKTLLPVSGGSSMQYFFAANKWANEWLPVCPYRSQEQKDPKPSFLKRFIEWLFNNKLGSLLDNNFMKITGKRWKRKEAKGIRNEKGAVLGLITDKHFAFSNPGAFKEKVLAIYSEKLKRFDIIDETMQP